MSEVDGFAQIALGGYLNDKDELQETKPASHPNRNIAKSTNEAPAINEKDYRESLVEFREDIRKLKDKYRPFMKDYTPDITMTRKAWEHDEFQFRYETIADKKDIENILAGKGDWEYVSIPDYRGPVGRWTGFYRREFTFDQSYSDGKRIYIKFLGVDYITNVYLNGRYIGTHEGFFAPFEFDITNSIKYKEKNILVVEVKNDATTLGLASWDERQDIEGDKIYAAAGLGWDDPQLGWHHCPPGAGIYNRVIIEERAEIFINDIFVRPDIDNKKVEVWVEVENTGYANNSFEMYLSVFSRNFDGCAIENIPCSVKPAGPGFNEYRFIVEPDEMRLWTPDNPWLYTVRISIYEDEKLLDEQKRQFGMRKIHMDETGDLKGSLYLNNKPVILRGSNDMGHMQLCVMKGDMEQLMEDILIAKYANMNFYRFTQRPQHREIYDYCDMLGMMNQTDLPLFGYQRKNQFVEGIRQAGEMEKLIRSHPSSIMISYINETFSVVEKEKEHRHLYRSELEDFFEGATKVVKLANPDRVIKNIEGDYDPPTRFGLSDFHCYNMWYTNHALPIGKLHKGYLPPLKKGWKISCGEYSPGEGLDPLEVMINDYPKDWLPEDLDIPWTPEKIVKSQTYRMHGDWYEEQTKIKEWIRESQKHQYEGTKLMTDAFRRRSDKVVSTAIHLLIDAWPSGWMKALVDYTRKPKPGYFAYKNALEPVRINLRTDRFRVYAGEKGSVEAWILNDTPYELHGLTMRITLRDANNTYDSFEAQADVQAVSPSYGGMLEFILPDLGQRGEVYLDAVLLGEKGELINQERLRLEVFNREGRFTETNIMYAGDENDAFIEGLGVVATEFNPNDRRPKVILVDSQKVFKKNENILLAWVKEGTGMVLLDEESDVIEIGEMKIPIKEKNGVTFLARNEHHEATKSFHSKDFSYPYNKQTDEISFFTTRFMDSDYVEPLVYTYEKPSFLQSAKGEKKKLSAAGCIKYGKGCIYISLLSTDGCIGYNPVLDRFYLKLLSR